MNPEEDLTVSTTAETVETPEAAVRRWWQAMQDRDVDALRAGTLPDYVSCGGPTPRMLDRDALLAQARAFFADARIDEIVLDDLVERRHGDVAVCTYAWRECGEHGGAPFRLAGVATDVLVLVDGAWRLQAHHVSMA